MSPGLLKKKHGTDTAEDGLLSSEKWSALAATKTAVNLHTDLNCSWLLGGLVDVIMPPIIPSMSLCESWLISRQCEGMPRLMCSLQKH